MQLSWTRVLRLLALTLVVIISVGVVRQFAFPNDVRVLEFIAARRTPAATSIFRLVSDLVHPYFVTAVSVLLGLSFISARRRLWLALLLGNSALGLLLSYGLKAFFVRPRPDAVPALVTETTFSYPSGHSVGVVILYGFLARYLVWRRPRLLRPVVWSVVFVVFLVAFSRLYLGVHYPTDVVAGVTLAYLGQHVLFAFGDPELSKLSRTRK